MCHEIFQFNSPFHRNCHINRLFRLFDYIKLSNIPNIATIPNIYNMTDDGETLQCSNLNCDMIGFLFMESTTNPPIVCWDYGTWP